jgi:hypothetical protein
MLTGYALLLLHVQMDVDDAEYEARLNYLLQWLCTMTTEPWDPDEPHWSFASFEGERAASSRQRAHALLEILTAEAMSRRPQWLVGTIVHSSSVLLYAVTDTEQDAHQVSNHLQHISTQMQRAARQYPMFEGMPCLGWSLRHQQHLMGQSFIFTIELRPMIENSHIPIA